jgi:amidase
LKRAEELDAHLDAKKPPLGPLHGVPVSLKDTFKVRGYDASIGLAALCFNPATENAVLVDNLLSAGAVLYCKTNIPQTLMALDSHNNVFGRTMNPFNTAITPGGSSGGEGALLGMRGSVLGVGTDVGGSIRIPAMCNATFGVKPSWERIPYAGQEGGALAGAAKVGIPASAGPLAHSMRDIELFFRAVSEQRPWKQDPDVVPAPWSSLTSLGGAGRKLRIGIVRRDGVIDPHPPIARLLDEVKDKLQKAGVEVVEMDITPLFSKCQSLANAMFGVEGGNNMFDLLESANEPLSPWLSTRLKRKPALELAKVRELHGKREELRKKFLSIWRDQRGEIDAFICPVAPHPVPPIDRYNGVSYTSSFVLLDYPAGTVPVRTFEKKDMEGEMSDTKPLGNWDKANRELCKYCNTYKSFQIT